MPILIGVTDAYAAPIGKLDAGRALNVYEERFDRVIYPDELPPPQPCLAGLDFRARPIRQHTLAVESSANALGLELGEDLSQLDREQIVRRRIQRIAVAIVAHTAALQQRLVVAGHPSDIDPVRGGDPVWSKLRFEKRARARVVVSCDGRRGGAYRSPDGCRFG